MQKKKILLLGLLLMSASVYAADQPQAGSNTPARAQSPDSAGQAPNEAVGIKLGPGLRGLAGVTFRSTYISNFFLQEQNPQSAFGFLLAPNLLVVGEKKQLRYQLGAGLDAAKFTNVSSGPSKYLDANVSGNYSWKAGTRHHFSGDALSKYGHDPFGSFRTENNVPLDQGLDKWIENSGNLRYRYGADGATINLESELGADIRRYETNQQFSQYLDYRMISARETVFYNVSSKTSLLAEVLHSNQIFYTQAPGFPKRGGQENIIRGGMHWRATAKTTGDIRIGQYTHGLDDPSRPTVRAFDWAATVSWAPLVYSVITLQTGNQQQPSYLANVFYIQNRYVSLNWVHDWSSALRTRVAVDRVYSDFVGSSRQDRVNTGTFEADLRASQRWFWLAGTTYSRRSSNEVERGYNYTLAYLGLRYQR
jgi:hypothetical protein